MRIFFTLIIAGFSLISYADANSLLAEKCSLCHAQPNFTEYTPSQWSDYVDTMAPNAQLNEEEIKSLKALNQ